MYEDNKDFPHIKDIFARMNAIRGKTDFEDTLLRIKALLISSGMIIPTFLEYCIWFGLRYNIDDNDFYNRLEVSNEDIIECSNYYTQYLKNSLCESSTPGPSVKDHREKSYKITRDQMKQFLKPIEAAFDSPSHLDKIVDSLMEQLELGVCTAISERKPLRAITNSKFYEPFVTIWDETDLTPAKIADVLTRFIYQNNCSRNEIAPGTIRKNIYEWSKRHPNRNKP